MGIYYNNKWCKEKVEEEEENARRWPLSLAPEKVVYLFTIMYGFFCRQDGKCACIAWYLCYYYYIRIYIHTSYKIYYLDFILLLFSARLKRRPIYFFYPFYYILLLLLSSSSSSLLLFGRSWKSTTTSF